MAANKRQQRNAIRKFSFYAEGSEEVKQERQRPSQSTSKLRQFRLVERTQGLRINDDHIFKRNTRQLLEFFVKNNLAMKLTAKVVGSDTFDVTKSWGQRSFKMDGSAACT